MEEEEAEPVKQKQIGIHFDFLRREIKTDGYSSAARHHACWPLKLAR
jgi:hypothetical protein